MRQQSAAADQVRTNRTDVPWGCDSYRRPELPSTAMRHACSKQCAVQLHDQLMVVASTRDTHAVIIACCLLFVSSRVLYVRVCAWKTQTAEPSTFVPASRGLGRPDCRRSSREVRSGTTVVVQNYCMYCTGSTAVRVYATVCMYGTRCV